MKYKLKRLATFIDKYGARGGIGLYLSLKLSRVHKVRVPGITHPFYLRKKSSDIAIFDQIFLFDEYNIEFPFHPEIIVDAGANIGLFAIAMKNRYPRVKIICIEPDEDNYEILKKNLAPYKDVELIRAGIWNSITKLDVVDRYKQGHSALVVEENEKEGNTPAITMDKLMEDFSLQQVDILKIDIETGEKELFTKNYEQWLPKVRVIVIELHDWLKEGCSKTFFEAINKSFSSYIYTLCGENTIIENNHSKAL